MVPYTVLKSKLIAVPIIKTGVALVYADSINEAIIGVESGNADEIHWYPEHVDYNRKSEIKVYEEETK